MKNLKKLLSTMLAFFMVCLLNAGFSFAADVDLSVSAVASNLTTIYDGDNVTLYATVRNYSQTDSGAIYVDFYADNTIIETVSSGTVEAGGYKISTTTAEWTPFFGTHKIKAVVRTQYDDLDKSNDSFSQRVTVLDEVNPNPPITPERKKVVGYIPNWSYSCYQTLDWSALTHLNIAFVNPTQTGDLDHGFWEGDLVLKNIVNKAHENNVKVLISMGGAGGTANYIELTASDKVESFCDKIMAFVEAFNIDGVDIDVEGDIGDVFWNNYENFVSNLRVRCTEKNKLLTTAVGQWYAHKISDTTFDNFDFVNVMAYDDDKGQHSSYDLAQNMLNYFEGRGIEKERLVLGVPFYGYTTDTGAYTAYKDIISQYPDFYINDYAGNYAYNGTTTIASKSNLAKGYGGIMIWELSQDVSGDKSLLKAIKDNLN